MEYLVIEDFSDQSIERIRGYVAAGGKLIQLAPSCPKEKPPVEVPEDVMIHDLRFGGASFIRGNHPRLEGIWTQYSHLETGLARSITLSQTITDQTPIENWRSQRHAMQEAPVGALDSEVYRHAHNHFQLLHSEVYNFSRDLNGVAIWGDSAALAPNAKSWGAFFSARSWPLKWSGYTPSELFSYDEATEFDAALIGVEIDVLNSGRDWSSKGGIDPKALAKVGLQIVGFGQRNTAAIEVRTEDSDDGNRTPENRRGAWHWGIIMRNSLASHSTVLMSENGRIARGIDFDKTTFTEGAIRITGAGANSGLLFDGGRSGEIHADAASNSLSLRVGPGGLKILSSDGSRVLAHFTDEGIVIEGQKFSRRFWRFLNRFAGLLTRPE